MGSLDKLHFYINSGSNDVKGAVVTKPSYSAKTLGSSVLILSVTEIKQLPSTDEAPEDFQRRDLRSSPWEKKDEQKRTNIIIIGLWLPSATSTS